MGHKSPVAWDARRVRTSLFNSSGAESVEKYDSFVHEKRRPFSCKYATKVEPMHLCQKLSFYSTIYSFTLFQSLNHFGAQGQKLVGVLLTLGFGQSPLFFFELMECLKSDVKLNRSIEFGKVWDDGFSQVHETLLQRPEFDILRHFHLYLQCHGKDKADVVWL